MTLLASVVLAFFAGQTVREDEVEVNSERSDALEVLDERFGDHSSVLQVLIQGEEDVRSVNGLRTSLAIQRAVERSTVADTLIGGQQPPPVLSYLSAVEMHLEAQSGSIDELTDADVRALADQATAHVPEQVATLIDELVTQQETADVGMLLFFQDTAGLDDEQVRVQQRQLAQVVEQVDTPDSIMVEPFSFALLLDSDGDVGSEVAQLFAAALAAVLLVLALVYWRPSRGRRTVRLRRTAADVVLTLAVILLAVVWMQGLGVLLGLDYLGLIGYFSPSSQIVPILIVGLGVDFAIHLLTRYRNERRADVAPRLAAHRSVTTVGVALTLGTVATATGFLTNLASPLDFLGMLGVLAAIGILTAFLLAVTFLPAVRVLLDERAERRAPPRDATTVLPSGPTNRHAQQRARWVMGTARLAERAPATTVTVAAVIAGLAVVGASQLESRFEVTDFVPRDEPMLQTFNVLTDSFDGGFDGQVEILLTGTLQEPDMHNTLVSVHDQLTDLDTLPTGIGGVTSPISTLRAALDDDALRSQFEALGVEGDGTVTDTADLGAIYDLLLEQTNADGTVLAIDAGHRSARIAIDTPVPPDTEAQVLGELDNVLTPLTDHNTVATATSQQLVQHELTREIADSQLTSLLAALAAAASLLAAYYRATRRRALLGVLTVLPAALVVAVTLAAMAATGIPLNPVTATLAALSIGIAVPFTIHITNRYLEERDQPEGPDQAIRRTLAGTGTALAASAITTAIGFGVLTTSALLPFRQLGQVTLYAISSAFVAAILVLPSLLTLWERRQPNLTDAADAAQRLAPADAN